MNSKQKKSLRLPARIENLEKLIDCILEEVKKAGIGPKPASDIHLAADEACTNAISYAYPPGEEKDIEVTCSRTPEEFTVTIRDWGKPFNPLQTSPPNLDLELEERPVGGLGIFLMKKFADRIDYRREDDSNLLTIIKKTG